MLPLSIPGAVSMTHVEGDSAYLSSDAWFVFKFDKQQVCANAAELARRTRMARHVPADHLHARLDARAHVQAGLSGLAFDEGAFGVMG